jgi:hypothetical protein
MGVLWALEWIGPGKAKEPGDSMDKRGELLYLRNTYPLRQVDS